MNKILLYERNLTGGYSLSEKNTSTRYVNIHDDATNFYLRKDKSGNITKVQTDKDLPVLYSDKKDCCGCSACFSACHCQGFGGNENEKDTKGAITMMPDEEGFLYPVVDAEICIRCYQCISVCDFK